MNDRYWNAFLPNVAAAYRPWLHDRGSLTQRIRQRCMQFAVQPVRSGLARIAYDESSLLGIAPQQLAWSREVFLHADGMPVVFAHSACALQHLRGAWAAVGGLGDKPLGAMLFKHPLVRRGPLRFKALHRQHLLYRRAAAGFDNAPARLWARRSLFMLHDAPLLVTEVFLPQILLLGKQA